MESDNCFHTFKNRNDDNNVLLHSPTHVTRFLRVIRQFYLILFTFFFFKPSQYITSQRLKYTDFLWYVAYFALVYSCSDMLQLLQI